MRNYINFRIAEPKTEEQKKLQEEHNVLFLYSDAGEEWYSVQQTFAADSIKFSYESDTGVIRSIAMNKDVSTLWPENMGVAEVPDTVENQLIDISGGWVFDGENIAPRKYTQTELIEQAESTKKQLLAVAATKIAPLQDAVDLDIATSEENTLLLTWKKYRVLLNRVDTSTAPDISWPEQPK